MTPAPPKLALALLNRFGPDDEALAGDLAEEFAAGRSRLWFWKQTLLAVFDASFRGEHEIRPLRLVEDESPLGSIGARSAARPQRWKPVNITASPIAGVGGLGLVTLGALVTLVAPQVWWIVACGMAAGVALGVGRVLTARRRR